MPVEQELKQQLDDLGARINAKVESFKTQGVLHGAEREAAADRELQNLRSGTDNARGQRPWRDLTTDLDILRLTFERFLARVEKGL